MTTIKANNGVTYTLPKHPKWHRGPPPSVGWWPASVGTDLLVIRYYDGKVWSDFAEPEATEVLAAEAASIPELNYWQKKIAWSERWWE